MTCCTMLHAEVIVLSLKFATQLGMFRLLGNSRIIVVFEIKITTVNSNVKLLF
jgi:hypothetical protein